MTVPGIGTINSSAMVAAIGTRDASSKGRDFGAWLGLVPKQISTGTERSSAAYQSAATGTYAHCSYRPSGLCWLSSWERYRLKAWIEAAQKPLHRNVLAIARGFLAPPCASRAKASPCLQEHF
jgi:transposase